jgi:hypothetical protein
MTQQVISVIPACAEHAASNGAAFAGVAIAAFT